MAKIKNMGTGIMKFGEGIIVSGSNSPHLYVSGNIGVDEYIYHNNDADTFIQFDNDSIHIEAGGRQMIKFVESATDKITINNGGNDIDLQVKGSNYPNLIRTDAANDALGINTASPKSTLSVAGSLALNVTGINAANDPGTAYTLVSTDCVILINTRATNEGGINSAITVTLPDASDFPGRVVTIKDAAGYCDVNAITISTIVSDKINGIDDSVALSSPASFKTFISDGDSSWQEIGS